MEKLAIELNKTLEGTPVLEMLSDYGKRMYVPNGIVVQSAQAKKKATKYNATIGIAMEHKQAMHLSAVKEQFADSMSVGEIFPYAPMAGLPALRQKWQDDMREKNPLLKNTKLSMPVVCAGLTSCLSVVCALWLDKDQPIIMPDLYWENYNLILDEQVGANKVLFKYFDEDHFNLKGLDKAIGSISEKKIAVLINVPNNPTGYSPSEKEADGIAKILLKYARKGKLITIITDDAYFGLFYERETFKQSLFAKTCNLHKNILAVKCDGTTKEELAWGFRVAFITYASKGLSEAQLDVLATKTMGTIRGRMSCCSTSAQNIILKAMNDSRYSKEKKEAFKILEKRYQKLKKCLKKYEDNFYLTPLPFNSGYFMSFKTKCDAEELRQLLLNKYETGTIMLGEHLLRIAFSSVDVEDIPGLVKTLYTAAEELCSQH